MNILMAAAEAAPFAKTGGLADVLGALPAALRDLGHDVAVVMPRYRATEPRLGPTHQVIDALAARRDASVDCLDGPVPHYFVNCPALYGRDGLYGERGADFPDNPVRFATLARAAIALTRYVFRPDVIHCHDWQAGLLPAYLRTSLARDPAFTGVKTLFTIHNLAYQGLFPPAQLPETGLNGSVYHPEGIEFWGQASCMKSGLIYSDALSTVSAGYAREIQTAEFGCGLDGILRARSADLHGIVNGIDQREWDPRADPHIAAHYSGDDLAGKLKCKRDLLGACGLPAASANRPLIGVVSRFDYQKGIDLIAEAAPGVAALGASLVVLGTGDPKYEDLLRAEAAEYPDSISVRVGYDNTLAHKIEAGADIFLMPSRYEPCGLNQMYSLRYGTPPVVRATGGLNDTIESETGFKFSELSGEALLGAIRTALEVFSQRERWIGMMRAGMRKDFSWRASAGRYSALYNSLMG